MTKAIGLLSGGLDSTLAVRMMLEQGIEVIALNFTSPFCTCTSKGCKHEATRVAQEFDVQIKIISHADEFMKVVRNPKHGYGKNMNPCIDCRILMMRKAKEYMEEIGATFIFTGEVLGQRPMSQRMVVMKLIEKEAGLEGLVLRPLSAKHFKATVPEKNGLVEREKLLNVSGRSRKPQMELADKYDIKDYHCPAGGCLLTSKEFSNKVRDLLEHKKNVVSKDLSLLRVGRHFRYGRNKIIVGRNENENKVLLSLKQKTDYVFEVPDCGSPITLLQGDKNRNAIETAASLTARYSDSRGKSITVKYGKNRPYKPIVVRPAKPDNIAKHIL